MTENYSNYPAGSPFVVSCPSCTWINKKISGQVFNCNLFVAAVVSLSSDNSYWIIQLTTRFSVATAGMNSNMGSMKGWFVSQVKIDHTTTDELTLFCASPTNAIGTTTFTDSGSLNVGVFGFTGTAGSSTSWSKSYAIKDWNIIARQPTTKQAEYTFYQALPFDGTGACKDWIKDAQTGLYIGLELQGDLPSWSEMEYSRMTIPKQPRGTLRMRVHINFTSI